MCNSSFVVSATLSLTFEMFFHFIFILSYLIATSVAGVLIQLFNVSHAAPGGQVVNRQTRVIFEWHFFKVDFGRSWH